MPLPYTLARKSSTVPVLLGTLRHGTISSIVHTCTGTVPILYIYNILLIYREKDEEREREGEGERVREKEKGGESERERESCFLCS